jgi:hypothetical protein
MMPFGFMSLPFTLIRRLARGCVARPGRPIARLGAALVWVTLAGCGDEKWAPVIKDAAFPVKGKVLLPGGRPLAAGRIEFHPVQELGLLAHGAIASDGTFALRTRQAGDGAIPGTYKVRIMLPERREFTRLARYRDEDSSRLTVTVRAEPNNLESFQLR